MLVAEVSLVVLVTEGVSLPPGLVSADVDSSPAASVDAPAPIVSVPVESVFVAASVFCTGAVCEVASLVGVSAAPCVGSSLVSICVVVPDAPSEVPVASSE